MTSIVRLDPIDRHRVATVAIDRIKALILDGHLGPHDRLPTERDLAEQLGVSRPTVREAIRALISMRILVSRQGDGTFVSSLDPSELAEPIDFLLRVDDQSLASLFDTREVLETGLARLAASRATSEDVARIDRALAEFRLAGDDIDKYILADVEFHEAIAIAARSPIMSSMLSSISKLGIESRKRTAQSRTVREATVLDHEAIIFAISAHDVEGAAQAMMTHLSHARSALTP